MPLRPIKTFTTRAFFKWNYISQKYFAYLDSLEEKYGWRTTDCKHESLVLCTVVVCSVKINEPGNITSIVPILTYVPLLPPPPLSPYFLCLAGWGQKEEGVYTRHIIRLNLLLFQTSSWLAGWLAGSYSRLTKKVLYVKEAAWGRGVVLWFWKGNYCAYMSVDRPSFLSFLSSELRLHGSHFD